jgi:hypothetical protein
VARPALGPQLLARLPLVGVLVALAIWARLSSPAPAADSQAGVAALLASASEAEVAEDGYVWERSHGWLVDTMYGRRVLFLAARDGAPRDLYRARVRVSREGRALSAHAVQNLTHTPLGDEGSLVAFGEHAAYATRWQERVQGVTLLDLVPRRDAGLVGSIVGRFTSAVEPDRIEVSFLEPPEAAELQMLATELRLAIGTPPVAAALSFTEPKLEADRKLRAEIWRQPLTQSLSVVEELTRTVNTLWRPAKQVESEASGAIEATLGAGGWPPPGVTWEPAREGQDALLVARSEREASSVWLVAIDTRRIDIGYRAGRRFPTPSTGPHGVGTLGDETRARAIAIFNGAANGHGAIDRGRVLVPPQTSAPTVAIDRHGRASLGPWPRQPPKGVMGARQMSAALVQNGQRGEQAVVAGARSALGRTRDGHLIYAYSAEARYTTIAEVLVELGCNYAVALRSGGTGVGLLLLGGGDAEKLDPSMSLAPDIVKGSPDGFFALLSRKTTPQVGGLTWTPAVGRQPTPEAWPAIHQASMNTLGADVTLHHVDHDRLVWEIEPGTKENAAQTASTALDAAMKERVVVAVALGLSHRSENRRGLALDGAQTLPFRPFLGALEARPSGGLSITSTVEGMLPAGDASELLLLVEGGRTRHEAKRLGAFRERGAACIAEDGGLLIAIATYDNAAPVAQSLAELGCARVVELNRGRQVRAYVQHEGSPSPDGLQKVDTEPVQTVLFGLSGASNGRATSM